MMMAALIGCSSATTGRVRYNLVGVWFGTLGCAGNCSHQPQISFTLFNQESRLSGFYRCWTGSIDCPEPDEGGRVIISDPNAVPLLMRVIMKDGSRCLFQGLLNGDRMEGGRICYTARGSIRNGRWRVLRAY